MPVRSYKFTQSIHYELAMNPESSGGYWWQITLACLATSLHLPSLFIHILVYRLWMVLPESGDDPFGTTISFPIIIAVFPWTFIASDILRNDE